MIAPSPTLRMHAHDAPAVIQATFMAKRRVCAKRMGVIRADMSSVPVINHPREFMSQSPGCSVSRRYSGMSLMVSSARPQQKRGMRATMEIKSEMAGRTLFPMAQAAMVSVGPTATKKASTTRRTTSACDRDTQSMHFRRQVRFFFLGRPGIRFCLGACGCGGGSISKV